MICISCGSESDSCLCDKCKQTVDIEALCMQVMRYRPGIGENELWDRLSSELNDPRNFKNIVFPLTEEISSPKKEYLRTLCLSDSKANMPIKSRKWLYETWDQISGLSPDEVNRIRGLLLGARLADYEYEAAEELANILASENSLPWQVYYNLADYYTKTRRYDAADEMLSEMQKLSDDEYTRHQTQKLAEYNEKQKQLAADGMTGYLPSPNRGREEARAKYVAFLSSIGVEINSPVGTITIPTPIPKYQYPKPIETRDPSFDSFVAFDLETTGRSAKFDSIIEFGAIKVVNGQIIETKEFIFQELAKPYDRRITPEIQQLTGIAPKDVKDAREMWEVASDFLDFVGADILVGYNCISFDSLFLVRAGRYANRIIENPYFDVMNYAKTLADKLEISGKGISLEALAEKLDIQNPQAHRALADAVTTAKVFLKLKELDGENKEESILDFLDSLDEW